MTAPSRITTPFSAESTAAEVISGVDLTGKRAVVTGGASGIGVETARALAAAGAEVTLAVRNLVAGQETVEDIVATTDNKQVYVAALELADPASVRSFLAGWSGPLHILVNNAGVMAPPLTRTPQGWELQFATNHLGHFGLTTGLHQALAAAGGARVVSVSSTGHLRSSVEWDDIHFERREYEPWLGYGQSKTSNILLAVEIATRWADDGIVANALHPGGIRTALQRHISEEVLNRMRATAPPGTSWKSVQQGAATSVLLAASPVVAGVTGRYFEDCNEAVPNTDPAVRQGVAAYALDPENASRLWAVSEAHLASV
jgi:NAD(P)-dependent dehydrogenase (short-subunit alcohol dehydrogenase family)